MTPTSFASCSHLTSSRDSGTQDLRCPVCSRLQFRFRGTLEGVEYMQRKCRCKAMIEILNGQLVISTHSLAYRF